jgi:hypothetical protein
VGVIETSAGIAGVVDRGVGCGNRSLVTGFDRRDELRGSSLHSRHQLVDAIIGGKDLRLDLALGDIGTGWKQGPVEGAGEASALRRQNRVRTRLLPGGSWIRALGPPIANGSFRFGEGEAGKGTETTRGGPDTLST